MVMVVMPYVAHRERVGGLGSETVHSKHERMRRNGTRETGSCKQGVLCAHDGVHEKAQTNIAAIALRAEGLLGRHVRSHQPKTRNDLVHSCSLFALVVDKEEEGPRPDAISPAASSQDFQNKPIVWKRVGAPTRNLASTSKHADGLADPAVMTVCPPARPRLGLRRQVSINEPLTLILYTCLLYVRKTLV